MRNIQGIFVVFAVSAAVMAAQEVASPVSNKATGQSTVVVPPGAPNTESALSRWIDINAMSLTLRYRSETASSGFRYFSNGQQKSLIDGRFKFDRAGRYSINFRASSGQTFNWAFSDIVNTDFEERLPASAAALYPKYPLLLDKLIALAEAGYPIPAVGSRGWEMYFRQLYISARPVNWLTLEYGGLPIERGVNSEITSYDDDGYISGERLRVQDPKHLYVDQIAITYAYDGDIFTPNFFERGDRLSQSNYHQFLVKKHFGSRIQTSADYTYDRRAQTVREAALVKIPETRVLDSFRLELYQRPNTVSGVVAPFEPGTGFGITGTRSFFHKFQLDGGFESVDYGYGANVSNPVAANFGFTLNGDSYSTGKHIFAHASYSVTPYLTASGFVIHMTQKPPADQYSFAREGFNYAITLDFKKLLNQYTHIL